MVEVIRIVQKLGEEMVIMLGNGMKNLPTSFRVMTMIKKVIRTNHPLQEVGQILAQALGVMTMMQRRKKKRKLLVLSHPIKINRRVNHRI